MIKNHRGTEYLIRPGLTSEIRTNKIENAANYKNHPSVFPLTITEIRFFSPSCSGCNHGWTYPSEVASF